MGLKLSFFLFVHFHELILLMSSPCSGSFGRLTLECARIRRQSRTPISHPQIVEGVEVSLVSLQDHLAWLHRLFPAPIEAPRLSDVEEIGCNMKGCMSWVLTPQDMIEEYTLLSINPLARGWEPRLVEPFNLTHHHLLSFTG